MATKRTPTPTLFTALPLHSDTDPAVTIDPPYIPPSTSNPEEPTR